MELCAVEARQVKRLLFDVQHCNPRHIADKLARTRIESPEDLRLIAEILFAEVIAKPSLCEAYADVLVLLSASYPELLPQGEGSKPITFSRVIVNITQDKYESLLNDSEAQFDRMIACMRFIGHLFVRRLLAFKVIGQVVHDLIGVREGEPLLPLEHHIQCVCELLPIIGEVMDSTQHGKALLKAFLDRLVNLSQLKRGAVTWYCELLLARIQDVLKLREDGWPIPLFIIQVKEVITGEIIATSLSGKECASVDGKLAKMTIRELRDKIAEEMGVLAGRVRLVHERDVPLEQVCLEETDERSLSNE